MVAQGTSETPSRVGARGDKGVVVAGLDALPNLFALRLTICCCANTWGNHVFKSPLLDCYSSMQSQ